MESVLYEANRSLKVDADPVDTRSRMKGASDRKPTNSENRNKRKRDPKDQGGDDPKFQEFLTVMQPSSKAKIWADSALEPSGGTVSAVSGKSNDVVAAAAEPVVEAQKKNKRLKFEKKAATQSATSAEPDTSTDPNPTEQTESGPQRVLEVEEAPQSDTDWLRSKTSRLLGLIDEEEETEARSRPVASAFSPIVEDDAKHGEAPQVDGTDGSSSEEDEEKKIPNPNIESIRGTGRLFVRNLPYDATESDLEPIFAPFGKTEEVRIYFLANFTTPWTCNHFHDDFPDRDIRCFACDVNQVEGL